VIASATRGRAFFVPHAFLPAGGELIALASGPSGPVLAVWEEFPPLRLHRHASLDYARLGPDGQLEATVVLSDIQGDDAAQPAFSVNDSGALAAAWIRGVGSPDSEVRAVLCTPTGHCKMTPSVERHPTSPFNVAVALSDDRTASVVSDVGGDHGVLAAVSRDYGAFSRPQRLASSPANTPVATPDGGGGALTAFNDGHPYPGRSFVWSTLIPTATGFTRPSPLGDASEIHSPVLAANLTGAFVIAWNDIAGRDVEVAHSSLAAAAGSGDRAGQPHVIAPTNVASQTLQAGIDDAGDAIVIWSEWPNNGFSEHGVFAATHSP